MDIRIIGAITFLCFVWGYLWVAVKINLQTFPPIFYTSLRLLFGGLCLLVIQLICRKAIFFKRTEWRRIFQLSLLMGVGYYGLSTFGMQYVDSGLSAIFVYTMPIIISILAHFYIPERLTRQKIVGLTIGFIGIICILWPQLISMHWNNTLMGEVIIIASAFCWAMATLYMKKEFSHTDKIQLNMWLMFISGSIVLIISLLTEPVSHVHWHDSTDLLYLIYSSCIATGIAMALWNWIVSKISASIASVSIMMVPLLGLLFGHLQLKESIGHNVIVGALFICAGIFCCSFSIQAFRQFKNR